MEQKSIFEIQASLCRSMSNPTRIEIIHILRSGSKCVSEIASQCGQSQGVVSSHLRTLSSTGIITSQHQGTHVYYQIANPKIAEICDLMRELLLDEKARRSELIQALETLNFKA
jgi:ArsR family transcriptional regulator